MLIIFNPTAGRRRPGRLWSTVDRLSLHGVRVRLVETQYQGHGEQLAREAVRAGERMIVAAGGDGTISEIAAGIVGSDVPLGVIPLGTANVLAHELELPVSPGMVAACLAAGHTRRLWPGLASGPSGSRLFVQMLGVGFDADVVHHLPPLLKRLFGRGAYVMQTLREIPRHDFAPVTLRADQREFQAAGAIVTKGRLYAGNYELAPAACPTEPGFSVVLFRQSGIRALLRYCIALPLNRLATAEGVEHLRAREVELLGNRRMPLQADGDKAGFTPVSIRDGPPVRIVAPA